MTFNIDASPLATRDFTALAEAVLRGEPRPAPILGQEQALAEEYEQMASRAGDPIVAATYQERAGECRAALGAGGR